MNKSYCSDYYDIVSQPISLREITDKAQKGLYEKKEELLEDFKTMHENSLKYNGEDSEYTRQAKALKEFVEKCLQKLK